MFRFFRDASCEKFPINGNVEESCTTLESQILFITTNIAYIGVVVIVACMLRWWERRDQRTLNDAIQENRPFRFT